MTVFVKKIAEAKVASNFAFLVPAGVSIASGLYISAAIALAVAAASMAYHLSGERRGALLDRSAACALIACNLVMIVGSGFRLPFAAFAMSALCVAIHFFCIRSKDDWEWHMSSAAVSVFCVLAYSA